VVALAKTGLGRWSVRLRFLGSGGDAAGLSLGGSAPEAGVSGSGGDMVSFVCVVPRRESRESLSFGVWSGAGSVKRKPDIFASLSAALKKSLRIRPLTQGEDRLIVGLRHRPVRVAWCARLGAGLGFLYPPFLGVQVWLSGIRPFWAGGGGCLSHPDAGRLGDRG
jgi:hypothetical protein